MSLLEDECVECGKQVREYSAPDEHEHDCSHFQSAPMDALRADNEKLKALVTELANDLEDELRGRYGDDIHPALLRKFNRDMEPVLRARSALKHEQP